MFKIFTEFYTNAQKFVRTLISWKKLHSCDDFFFSKTKSYDASDDFFWIIDTNKTINHIF